MYAYDANAQTCTHTCITHREREYISYTFKRMFSIALFEPRFYYSQQTATVFIQESTKYRDLTSSQ